jgi:hypothetical protein
VHWVCSAAAPSLEYVLSTSVKLLASYLVVHVPVTPAVGHELTMVAAPLAMQFFFSVAAEDSETFS